MKGFFITSNNTDAGKTFVTRHIIKALNDKYNIEVRKPIETGCQEVAGKLLPNDALLLQNALKNPQHIDTICPYKFTTFASGEIASKGSDITREDVVAACQQSKDNNFIIVEGAGGFYSPMLHYTLNSDIAIALGLPVVIVIEDKLGAISEALLTIAAVEQNNVAIFAIVLNQKTLNDFDNCNQLQKYTPYAVLEFKENNTQQFDDYFITNA